MNDVAILEVQKYLGQFEDVKLDDPMFETLSYSKWAAGEILHLLMDRPCEPADSIIEEFSYLMTLRSYECTKPRKSQIFTIAVDVADEILQLI